MRQNRIPDGMPVLSPGRHRRARKGACFMEFASYLAGEKWSDHPECTHPLLAGIARTVNDLVDGEHRVLLVPLIPEVVGLTGDDLVIDVTLTARCAMAALPVASMDYQRALAVGLLTCDRVAATLDGPSIPALRRDIAQVLAFVPDAATWAVHFTDGSAEVNPRLFRRVSAPRIVAFSGRGIASAVIMDPDERLVELLRRCIADTQALVGAGVDAERVRVAPEPQRSEFDVRSSAAAR
ncbi:MAG: hypothetical protein ABI131_00220 [Nostocoides sp.]